MSGRVRRLGVSVGARPGLLVLALSGVSLGLHLWLAQSLLLPLLDDSGIEYVFVSASSASLAILVIGALVAMFASHLVVRRAAARMAPQPPKFTAADVGYAIPLVALLASAAMLLALVPAIAPRYSVALFFLVDLRWWWTAVIAALTVARVDARFGGPLRRLAQRMLAVAGRGLPQLSLVALAGVWVVMGTPNLRFSPMLNGDEPKYVRYCENFYQGLGFDISGIRAIRDLPADFQPQVWNNLSLLATMLPGELRSLVGDTRLFLADPSRKFNRAYSPGAMGVFVGKDGGLYQLHPPGLSMMMFPAYYLDRRFATTEPAEAAQWPAQLIGVNAFFLGIYLCWTVLIFRFARAAVGSTWIAWMTTAALVLTIPVSAFAFQIYPEAAAGVLVTAIAHHLLFTQKPRLLTAIGVGFLIGYLPWLHVRFSALVGLLVVTAIVLHYRQPSRVLALIGGAALPLAAFALFAYRLTGSVMPTAMYGAVPADQVVFEWAGVGQTSLAYLVDRDWGLFAHSPVYLLPLCGYWWMFRARPAVVVFCLLSWLALLVPSAGHSLMMGGTTPMRTIMATLPLAAMPIAMFLARAGHLRLVQAAFGLLFLLSAQNALAYNLHHNKDFGPMLDMSVSGWKINALFPQQSRVPWNVSSANGVLLWTWCAILLALLALPPVWHRLRRVVVLPGLAGLAPNAATVTLAAAAVFVVVATANAALSGSWVVGRYLMPPEEAAVRSAVMLQELDHCTYCATTASGRVGTGRLFNRLDSVSTNVVVRRHFTSALAAARFQNRDHAYLLYTNDASYPEGTSFWTRGTEAAETTVLPAGASQLKVVFTCGMHGSALKLRVGALTFDRDVPPHTVQEVIVALLPDQRVVPVQVQAASAVRPSDLDPASTETRLLGCRVKLDLEPAVPPAASGAR